MKDQYFLLCKLCFSLYSKTVLMLGESYCWAVLRDLEVWNAVTIKGKISLSHIQGSCILAVTSQERIKSLAILTVLFGVKCMGFMAGKLFC